MTDRPPSLPTPTAAPTISTAGDDRLLATTAQLTDAIENALDCRLDETVLESLLLELDRHEYVDWVAVTRSGDHVWDLTESPERLGDVIAAAVVDRVQSWLAIDDR